MNISFPSTAQWQALGRHAVTYTAGAATGVAGILTFSVALHFITVDQSSNITGSLTDLGRGVKAMVDGLTTIVGATASLVATGSAIWAMHSSTKKAQAASLASQGDVVVTDPKTAAAVPSPNVVAAPRNGSISVPAPSINASVQVGPHS